jgi:hypothetical protein
MDCFTCGLPDATVKAKVRLRRENAYRRDSRRTLPFCNSECARQAMFLQLEVRSTRDSVTRFMGGSPINYAEFSERVPLEIVEGSDCSETIAESRVNTGSTNALIENLDPEYREGVSERHMGLYSRRGGRPRKWASDAERMKAYRQSQVEAR